MFVKQCIRLVCSVILSSLSYSIATENALKTSVATLMKVEPTQIELKKETKGMTSAQNYLFALNGKTYIVKIFSEKHSTKYRQKEIHAIRTFADLGLGAKLVAVGDKNSFYIRNYIPGKTLKYKDLQDNKVLETLAQAVRKLHKHKCNEHARGLLERAEKHYQKIAKKKVAVPTGFKKAYKKFKEVIKSLKVSEGFCHNDLDPHNIILTPEGAMYFIDFGNSGCSNIYEELGYVTLLNGISEEKLEHFLASYHGRKPTQEEIARVKLAQKLVCFVSATVYFDFSESKKDKETELKSRIANLDKLLQSSEVKSMLECIKANKVISVKSHRKDEIQQYAISCYKAFLEM